MDVNDHRTVGACNNDRKYKEKYVIKPHISAFDGSTDFLRFWKCNDKKFFPKWTFACNRKYFRGNKNSVICSNHFKYGRPTAASPYPTLYLKEYNISAISSKRKPPAERTTMKEKCQKRKKLILLKCKRNQLKLGHHC